MSEPPPRSAPAGPRTGSSGANPAAGSSAQARNSASKPRPVDARAKSVPSGQSSVVRTFEKVVNVVPTALKAVIAVLAFLTLVAAISWFFLARSGGRVFVPAAAVPVEARGFIARWAGNAGVKLS